METIKLSMDIKKFEIPYRTMTEWELGHRNAPPYVLRLLAYYIKMQKVLEENGINEGTLGGQADEG